MKRTIILLGVLMLAAIAWAAPGPIIDLVPRWMKAGLHVGTTYTVANRLQTVAVGTVDYAFPYDAGCQDSTSVTVTGARKGDPCSLGIGPNDGGNVMVAGTEGALTCVVTAANTAKVRLCPALTSGVDAGFTLRTFSNY